MGTASDHSVPDIIKLVEALGDPGANVLRRLTEAYEIVSQANAPSGFTSASERLKTSRLRDKGGLLMADAMSDAIKLLKEMNMSPERSVDPKP